MPNYNNKIYQRLIATFSKEKIRTNESLAKRCNWRVGGLADFFFVAETIYDLKLAIVTAKQLAIPVTVLGFGANVLVSDAGIRGLIILNRAQNITFLGNGLVEADSGANLATLAKRAAQNGVGGFEFLIGIPGTVGGAIAVNAGSRTKWISSILREALIVKLDGSPLRAKPEDLHFRYRHSLLKETNDIVLAAQFQGFEKPVKEIEETMAGEMEVRKTQPSGPSVGSVFTNPENDFAGRLIEEAGLKGYQIGGAKVSEMHANFIMNVGEAKASDMQQVIAHVKKTVASRFQILLQEEVRYLGEW